MLLSNVHPGCWPKSEKGDFCSCAVPELYHNPYSKWFEPFPPAAANSKNRRLASCLNGFWLFSHFPPARSQPVSQLTRPVGLGQELVACHSCTVELELELELELEIAREPAESGVYHCMVC